MAEPTQTVRITSITVEGLFGLYNHKVTLKEERVTVIHGPNGVGKTVFLKLTNAFLNGQYYSMLSTPFDTFQIEFSDGSFAKVEQKKPRVTQPLFFTFGSPEQVEENTSISITLQLANQPEQSTTTTRDLSEVVDLFDKTLPYLTSPKKGVWIDRRTDEILSEENLIARANEFAEDLPVNISIQEPEGLQELRQNIRVHFIETQRLIRFKTPRWNLALSSSTTWNTVEDCATNLQKKLETTLADYAKTSQKLDQTFPQRLLTEATQPQSKEQLKTDMLEIGLTRERLKNIGVLDREESDQTPLQTSDLDSILAEQLPVMVVYAKDSKQKLAVLKPLSEKVEILLKILNKKFTNKTVKISRESGLVIQSSNNKTIPISALSSGEQHELVLLYDLLFKVEPNTLVMIDEPELSLHISWQKDFMDDLLEIIRVAQFDVLLATHSPYIVGDHSELMVDLSSDIAQA